MTDAAKLETHRADLYSNAQAVFQLLQGLGAILSTAESCTGGMVATAMTAFPGSSAVYAGGISSYSNALKIGLLGVEERLIIQFGAVSEQVAKAMAKGVADQTGSHLALSITGVAGPGGGSTEKPIGTVWLGMHVSEECFSLEGNGDRVNRVHGVHSADSGRDGGLTLAKRLSLKGEREEIRLQAATLALAWCLQWAKL